MLQKTFNNEAFNIHIDAFYYALRRGKHIVAALSVRLSQNLVRQIT